MRIAINTRFLLPGKMEGFGWYTYEVTKRLVEQHPEHEFFFFFDRPFDEKFIFAKNVTPVILRPPARHPLLYLLWFELAVPKALKKYRIDVFFSPDGYLSLRSNVPQIPVIHDINFEHFPKDLPYANRKYLRYFFPRFARKAKHIITVSDYSKSDILNTYSITEDKVSVAWNGSSDVFKPLSEQERIAVRQELTNGKSYLLFVGAIHPRKNVRRLIEAFLEFRKTASSEVELVVVGTPLWRKKGFDLKLTEEQSKVIHFTGHLAQDRLARIMGAASLFVYVPYFEGFGIPLVEAMKCGTPILAGNRTSLPEVAGPAAEYCDPFDTQDIANKMSDLIADEKRLAYLSNAGIERSKLFDWQASADLVWETISRQFNP